MLKVAGCIITFNPEKDRLIENISSIISQIDYLYIVDNGSKNLIDVKEIISKYDKIELIELNANLGIAKALNVGCEKAYNEKYNYIITLDQDSVCMDEIIQKYKENIKDDIGLLHCLAVDRNMDTLDEESLQIGEIPRCITSASFVNLLAWKECGGFDNKMFIDCVDFDFCLMLRKYNYKIVRIDYCGFLHELGNASKHIFFGKEVYTSNHSVFRRYYITRNEFYYARKHKEVKFLNTLKCTTKNSIKVLVYEKHKIKKWFNINKGFIVGMTMKINYQDREK